MNEMAKNNLRSELMEIYVANGNLLPPQAVVNWARDHPDSELHRHFEWNDGDAAEAWRRNQARQLITTINIQIETPSGPRDTRMFVSLEENRDKHKEGGGYSLTAEVLSDDVRKKRLLSQALRELNNFQRKYAELEQLASVFEALETFKN